MNGCGFIWSEAGLLTTTPRDAGEDKRICHWGIKKKKEKKRWLPLTAIAQQGALCSWVGWGIEPKG